MLLPATPPVDSDTPSAKPWVWRIGALMLLAAGGAFAVAGFTTADQTVPVRQLVQAVTTLGTEFQIQGLDNAAMRLYRSDVSRSNDTAESLLRRLGINDKAATDVVKSHPLVRDNLLGRSGRMLRAETDSDNQLLSLTARWATDSNQHFQRLVIERQAHGFAVTQTTGELKSSVHLSGALIQSSLFAATDDAGIPDSIAMQVADIFAGDIDFHRSLRKGDRFTVSYESLEADGEPLKPGKVLSAEFVNKGKTYQAMWFQESAEHAGGYYTLDGQSMRRVYLASPLAFSRVTSGFKMRFHPILQAWRAHLGVDYAAPQGTPVRNVGLGVVETAGPMGGYGNVVVVKHNNGHSTVYAHLSKILVKRGQSVAQAQSIGLVGATGWATGPHLHFEFRVNGKHQDPLLLARQSETIPVSAHARERFNLLAKEVANQLSSSAVAFADTAP
jgi:murein DD-endopeptidase MepM/ murein hydrolase activator NlpD